MTYYVQDHVSQYDPSCSAFTRRNGCTWTAGCNGIGATSGGRYHPSPDYLHSLLPNAAETNPYTPGWSIPDLVRACSRYGITIVDRSGKGWADVIDQLEAGHYVVVQGDSDQFGNATCSGEFDGDHCIGISPNRRLYNGRRQWLIDDGICPDGRWEYEDVLKRYAQKLNFGIQYGAFLGRVPTTAAPSQPTTATGGDVAIRYSPTIAAPSSRIALKKGQRLYAAPGGKSVTAMASDGRPPQLGLTKSPAGVAWRAVQVGTKWSYSDGKAHKTVLYVPATAGKVVPA